MIYYHVPITHLENIPNSSVGKCCPCFHVSFFPLLICISVYGKERNNYDQHNIHLWGNMDSVAYLGSLNINHRITPCRCCWIDDCNWWTPIDAFIHDQACVWPAVLKYLPLLNSFTQPMLCLTQISPWENDSLFFFFFFPERLESYVSASFSTGSYESQQGRKSERRRASSSFWVFRGNHICLNDPLGNWRGWDCN